MIWKKFFKDYNTRYLEKIRPIINRINSLEREFSLLSDEELRKKTEEFKIRIRKSESLDDVLPEAFAAVREASKRTLKQRHYDVQLIGGIVLHQGKIAEMKTGEGKTLAATLPVYLNALEEKGVHIITVNDYLARRDAVWMGQIYNFLGLTVGCLNHEQSFLYDPAYKKPNEEKDKVRDELGSFKVVEDFLRPCSRKEAYLADITYGTNNEFGFDYLRDNMAFSKEEIVQRELNYAIVDEVDSILIDEARTPLIISAPDTESSGMYKEFAMIMPKLQKNVDYVIDEKYKAVTLTEEGIERVEKILGMRDIYQEKGVRYLHHLEQALRAEALFKKDRDYIVKNGKIVIIDEFTGRLMPGRRWSGGLHQAIEAKEGVPIQPESITLASITFQNFFRLYKKLAGMTGTAVTSAEEFDKVYNLEVIVVPTNKPMVRKDLPDRVLKTKEGKFRAILKEIENRHKKGQPILVGTRSVEINEYLSSLLKRIGIPHEILNAKNHEREGEIIAQAGKLGQVTVATNMAGRGVDIILGGNPPDEKEAQKVKELGGLFVLGTERHEARRIDDQLRGRSGRQGDPGESQFFLSLEDDLLRIFGGEKVKRLVEMLKISEDEPIESKMISGIIEKAQAKIEGMNFDLRRHLLEYDDVLNKHRDIFYKKRREILFAGYSKLEEIFLDIFRKQGIPEKEIKEREEVFGREKFLEVGRNIFLNLSNRFWIDYLEIVEHLKDSVRLRAYGQQDPVVEFKIEGHKKFQELMNFLEGSFVSTLLKVEEIKEV